MSSTVTKAFQSVLGQRLHIEPYGCEEEFARLLPREGKVIRNLEALNGVKDWYLLKLDEPIEFEGRAHEHF